MTELAAPRRKNKPGAGRPVVPEDQRLVAGAIRLSRIQWDEFYALGGATWLREAIKRATARKKAE